MDTTSATLLERVRSAGDDQAWREFYGLYFPLITKYARMRGLRSVEAEEVAQECMEALARHMRDFQYSRSRGRFRDFLRKMADNCVIGRWRRKRPLQMRTGELENLPAADTADEMWDRVWLREHLAFCLGQLESRCSRRTVQAFRLYGLQGWSVERVCQTLSLGPNQVYLAKARMIRRLRKAVTEMVGNVL